MFFLGNQTTLSTIVFFEFAPSLFENKAMVFTVRFGPMTNYTNVVHGAIGYELRLSPQADYVALTVMCQLLG